MPGITAVQRAQSSRIREEYASRGYGPLTTPTERRAVIVEMAGKGVTRPDIAGLFGISDETVRQVLRGYRNMLVTEEEYRMILRMRSRKDGVGDE